MPLPLPEILIAGQYMDLTKPHQQHVLLGQNFIDCRPAEAGAPLLRSMLWFSSTEWGSHGAKAMSCEEDVSSS